MTFRTVNQLVCCCPQSRANKSSLLFSWGCKSPSDNSHLIVSLRPP